MDTEQSPPSAPPPDPDPTPTSSTAGNEDQRNFECNICLDTARDAVVSLCGHLFCWPCLHQWLETRPTRQSCPVCKAAVSKDKVIPLYGRGGAQVDPRSKVPPRPTPTRQEAADTQNRFDWGSSPIGGGGFQMNVSFGAFPLGFFTSAFNWGGAQPPVGGLNQAAAEEQEFLSKVFLWVAFIFMVWLVLT